MSADAKAVWNYAVANAPAGMLKLLDAAQLTIWCNAKVFYDRAVLKVDQLGVVTKTPKQGLPMTNPWLIVANKQAQIMQQAAAELGFTPSARSRMRVGGSMGPGGGGGEENPFDQFR